MEQKREEGLHLPLVLLGRQRKSRPELLPWPIRSAAHLKMPITLDADLQPQCFDTSLLVSGPGPVFHLHSSPRIHAMRSFATAHPHAR